MRHSSWNLNYCIGNVTDNVTDVTDNVTDRQREILMLIENNANISVNEIADKFALNRRTILRDLKRLQNIGLLNRIGSEKNGYWGVVKNEPC